MKKILIVNVNWLGDVIFSSPIFHALRESYPQAHIACMGVPRIKEILESIPEMDEFIEYDEEGKHANIISKINFILKLRKQNFDAVFFLSKSKSRAFMIYLSGIPTRVGYENKNRSKWLTHIVSEDKSKVHRSDYYLRVIESFGIRISQRTTRLDVFDEVVTKTHDLLRRHNVHENDFKIAINPGGNWDLKRWPVENFSKLINLITKEKDVKCLIVGSDKDKELEARILNQVYDKRNVKGFCGQTNLQELMAVMEHVDLVVSADSGPIHIANSLGTNVIGIFGPTRPEITGPRGSGKVSIIQKDVGCNRSACYHLQCPDNICMKAVSALEVYETIKKFKN